jgi:pimeloyl-ACP methyl ester carboxylesterase
MIGTGPSLPSGFYDRFEHRFTDVEQVRLHHVDGGRVASPCVVLMHGWPQTWYAWRKVMPELVDLGYRVIAVDYRGAGDSTRPATGYDKVTMAGDIAQLLTELGTGSVHLVARDVGLMVAYALATRWPETVSTLTMVDVPIPGTGAWERAKRDPATWHFGLHQQRDVAESLVDGREFDYLSTFYRARTQVAQAITDDDLAVYARSYAQPGGMRAGFELYRAFEQDEQAFRESLATKLAIPVLAVGGELDNATLIAETAHEAAENVTVAVVPGGGHWTSEENPGFLLEQLRAFLPDPRLRPP